MNKAATKAAQIIAEAHYGKPAQQVDMEAQVSVSPLADALMKIAQAMPSDEEPK